MVQHYNLVVVGAGPAGAAAACTGAGLGLRTAVIDKARFPRDKLCGGLVTQRCAGHLSDVFGLTPADPLFETRRRIAFYMDEVPLGQMADIPPLHLTMRRRFDARLLAQALAAGAADYTGRRIDALLPDENRLTLRDGTVLSYDLLIGADGVQSQVARALFGRPFDRARVGFALEVEAPPQAPAGAAPLRIDFGAADWGYGWQFPKAGSTTIGLGGVQARNPDMQARLADYIGRHAPGCTARVKGHFLPFGEAKPRPGRGNVLLAGDAAGLVDPITGEGIGHAVHSGRLAAEAAAQALARGRPAAALGLYRRSSAPIRRAVRMACLLRPLIFAGPPRPFFRRAFAGSRRTRADYMRLLAGELEYPALLARVTARLPRALWRHALRPRDARRPRHPGG
jgi:geranylgeranyl reductase family protein